MLGVALLCLATESEAEVAKSEAAESDGRVKEEHLAESEERTVVATRPNIVEIPASLLRDRRAPRGGRWGWGTAEFGKHR